MTRSAAHPQRRRHAEGKRPPLGVRSELMSEHRSHPPVRRVWRVITHNPLASATVAGIVVLLFGYFVLDPFGGSETQRPGIVVTGQGKPHEAPEQPPKNATEEAAQRTFWASPPQTFAAAGERGRGAAAVSLGDVLAFTPRELVERAPSFEGESIYLVGRVVAVQQRKSTNGLDLEVHVRGREPDYDAYIGTGNTLQVFQAGEVVYALGQVAAVGESKSQAGRRVNTLYFFASDTEFDTVVDVGSREIRRAAKAVRKRR